MRVAFYIVYIKVYFLICSPVIYGSKYSRLYILLIISI
nr:MAG TPA: hypothetical protein [Caudoviricetes sp.]